MAKKIIPLTTDPDQNFTCTLPIDANNISLFFRLRYNTIAGYWVVTIASSQGIVLMDSMPLFNGTYPSANLLKQHSYLNIGSAYIVKTGKLDADSPSDSTLGAQFVLVWSDTP